MAAITTHDLPTLAGLWLGSDIRTQRELGLEPNEEGWAAARQRLKSVLGVEENAPVEEVIVGAHDALAGAPSMLVSATLDDALAVEQRPNMPGTMTEWPNWRLALPLSLDELERHPLALRLASALQRPR
jgi:4-alpha-glucanotransferase